MDIPYREEHHYWQELEKKSPHTGPIAIISKSASENMRDTGPRLC